MIFAAVAVAAVAFAFAADFVVEYLLVQSIHWNELPLLFLVDFAFVVGVAAVVTPAAFATCASFGGVVQTIQK